MKRYLVVLGALALWSSVPALAEDKTPADAKPAPAASHAAHGVAEHVALAPGDLKWIDAPAPFPKGAKMVVLNGNPKAPGIFTMRIQVGPGFKVAPHWHPQDEHVTVLSGELYMGLGDTFDESKGHALTAGSFSLMPKTVHHYAWAKTETVFQVHGAGPWGINYVNPADDPANQKQATK